MLQQHLVSYPSALAEYLTTPFLQAAWVAAAVATTTKALVEATVRVEVNVLATSWHAWSGVLPLQNWY